MRKAITARQEAILRDIAEALKASRPVPTLVEMGKRHGVADSSIFARLASLRSRGLLAPSEGYARAYSLTPEGWALLGLEPPRENDAQVLAAVREADAAGEPLPARVVAALEAEAVPS